MAIGNTNPNPKDVVILQRDDTNTYYGETHISGSSLIVYIDSNGYVNADGSASFYSQFPPTNASGSSISASYAVTASFALNGGTGGNSVSSSWASQSLSSSYAVTASYAMNGGSGGNSVSSSWASQSLSSSFSAFATSASFSTTSSFSSLAKTSSFAITSSYL